MAEFRYRGRAIEKEDILYIRTLIEQYPKESRRKLSVRVCEAWQWRQANGAFLGGHPNPAIEGHLKTGHRETA